MWEKMYIKKFNILIKTEDEKKYTFILTKQAHFFFYQIGLGQSGIPS